MGGSRAGTERIDLQADPRYRIKGRKYPSGRGLQADGNTGCKKSDSSKYLSPCYNNTFSICSSGIGSVFSQIFSPEQPMAGISGTLVQSVVFCDYNSDCDEAAAFWKGSSVWGGASADDSSSFRVFFL